MDLTWRANCSLLGRERKRGMCLIFKHCRWITVFSLQIGAAFKGVMSISCLFFLFNKRPRCPVGRQQLENTQGKITIQKGEPAYSQNIPVECKLMFSTLWYFHVEFFSFAPKASFRWQTRLLNTEQSLVSTDRCSAGKGPKWRHQTM